jgi:chromosome segregation ATPase
VSVKTSAEIKGLQSQINKLSGEIASLNQEKKSIEQRLSAAKSKQNELIQKVKSIESNGEIFLTEHAIVRYFERVCGFDLKDIEKLLLPEDMRKRIKAIGDGEYPIQEYKIVVRGNKVITVK